MYSETAPDLTDSLAATPEEPVELAVFQQVKAQLMGRLLQPNVAVGPPTPLARKYARLRRSEVFTGTVPNWWLEDYGYNPWANSSMAFYFDPMGDDNGDGILNGQAFAQGVPPVYIDKDNDGFPAGEDTDDNDVNKHPPPVTELWVARKKIETWIVDPRVPVWPEQDTSTQQIILNNWGVTDAGIRPFGAETNQTAIGCDKYTSASTLKEGLTILTFPQNTTPPLLGASEGSSVEVTGRFVINHWNFEDWIPVETRGWTEAARIWLVHKPKQSTDFQKVVIKQRKHHFHEAWHDDDFGDLIENYYSIYESPGTIMTLTVPAGSTHSSPTTIYPEPSDFTSITPTLITPNRASVANYSCELGFLPLELAPEVLAVNSDFDEGRIDSATGYALPDCDDPQRYLGADQPHLDGRWTMGANVTEDMHNGWFGVKPSRMETDFWTGATVTIKKIDKTDPDTNKPESGEVRFYATDGVNNSSGYQCIEPYDLATHATVNLVTGGIYGAPGRSVYGTNTDILPSAKFWIEGVKPGKITLEWRYVKGSTDFKHEQTFKVFTKKTRTEWASEVNYQIRLQTKTATGTELDVSTYHPGDGFHANVPKVQAIYYYYQQLYRQMPEKFMWAGMAKTAAAPIYAGMSDLTEWYYGSEITPGTGFGARDVGTGWFINGLLLDGQRHIFNDKAWTHRAYQASGIEALKHTVAVGGPTITNLGAWRDIDEGIRNANQTKINEGNGKLLLREQEIVVQPDYEFIRTVWLRQPPAIAAWWFDATLVPVNGSGLANAAEWLTANSKKNPLNPTSPHAPSFLTTVPGGRLDVFADRWAWTSNPTSGMLELWTGTSTAGPNFNAAKRLLHAGKSMYSAASVYSYDTAYLPNE
jgi:hypothetical protein